MRFRLRTLLIALAIVPPLMSAVWWKYSAWRAEQERLKALQMVLSFSVSDLYIRTQPSATTPPEMTPPEIPAPPDQAPEETQE